MVPAFNERESLPVLAAQVRAALTPGFDWQLILVDDGSDDGTAEVLAELAATDARIEGVHLSTNRGQSRAIVEGLDRVRHDLVATMDADLQQDPADITTLYRELGSFDAVVGYREVRRDPWIRRVGSRIGNGVRNLVTGDELRDSGCSLRLVRRGALTSIVAFDGMHRFLPTLLRQQGYSVLEHPVSHRPRAFGRSKYGTWDRAARGIFDVFAVRWMGKRLLRRGFSTAGSARAREVKTPSERRPPRSA